MVSLHKPDHTSFDLHKRCLMLYAIMIFITEVWSGLCKQPLRNFDPTQRSPTLVMNQSHLQSAGIRVQRLRMRQSVASNDRFIEICVGIKFYL